MDPQRGNVQTVTSMIMIQALCSMMDIVLEHNDDVMVLGRGVDYFGGMFHCAEGLQKRHGTLQVFSAPTSESGIIGATVGTGAYGLHPVVGIWFADYVYPASDRLISRVTRLHYHSAGNFVVPIAVRMPCGDGIYDGQTYSQNPEAVFTQIRGLHMMIPFNPYDAKDLLIACIEGDDPVIFLEPRCLYNGPFDGYHDRPVTFWFKHPASQMPGGYYGVPLDGAAVVRPGVTLTVLAYGTMVYVVQAAADETGPDAEIIDLHNLWPLSLGTIIVSVEKTGRCTVTHKTTRTCGFGAELMSLVQEHYSHHPEAPIERATG